MRADNPNDSKKGGVGICYNEFLAARSVEVKYLNACIIGKGKGYIWSHSMDCLVKYKIKLTCF